MQWSYKAALFSLPTCPGCSLHCVSGDPWSLVLVARPYLPVPIKSHSLQDPKAGYFRHFSLGDAVFLKEPCWSRVADHFSLVFTRSLGTRWTTVAQALAFLWLLIPLIPCSLCIWCLYFWSHCHMACYGGWGDWLYFPCGLPCCISKMRRNWALGSFPA